MRTRFHILTLLFLFVFSALMAQEERVYSFHSDIDIEVNGTISVREEIKIYAAGNVYKRGLMRALPLSRRDVKGQNVRVSYNVKKVLQDGKKVNFFTESEYGDLVVYAGDKDRYLDPGFYTYEIFYTSQRQLGFFGEYDELYWNVNGASDEVTDRVSCTIRMPGEADIINYNCFTGSYGSTETNCSAQQVDSKTFSAEAVNIRPDEMLTVAVSFTPGVVQQKGTASYQMSYFEKYGLIYITLGFILFLGAYFVVTWRRYGVDPPKPTVIPLFSPPKGLSSAASGMVHKEVYMDDLITASIVSLAVKGFIQIREVDVKKMFGLSKTKHYELIKLKDSESYLPGEEADVMRELFRSGDSITITGSHDSDIENMMNSFRTSLKRKYNPILREGLNLKLHVIPWLLVPVYLFCLYKFSVFESMDVITDYITGLLVAIMPAIVVSVLIGKINKRLKRDLLNVATGFIVLVASGVVFYKYPLADLSPNAVAVLVGVPVLVIGYLIYARLIVRPGERKLELQAEIEGLKMYMDVAEEKQMQYFNPPEITPEVFEELLPYAIALKMDKIWGEKFQKKFLSSMAQQVAYQPSWYVGTVYHPAMFGNSLRNSLYSNIRTSGTPVASSKGGGWSSGTGGGGFSGGGGGGGRVGGW